MKRFAIAPILVLPLAACGPDQPCPTCDDDGADDDPPTDMAEDLPDLPCGGADLQNDDLNCGTCGNECRIMAAGDYEAGGCIAGVCSPTWYGKEWLWYEPGWPTCDEVCATATYDTLSCQRNGCVGLTGFVCNWWGFGPCDDTLTSGFPPLLDFSGSCEEPIPLPDEDANFIVYCCCG
jgi:hypothetical protein